MNIEITGRHVEITPALREFAEEKLRKLERLLDGPLEVHVVLGIEKHRHMAEIQVKSRTATLAGNVETGDLYASIGEVVDKLERQALKHKEKWHDHKSRRTARGAEVPAASGMPQGNAGRQPLVAPIDGGRRIVRTPSYRLKPLSTEDAVLELEATGQEILVFRDAETSRLTVVYRRANGDFGLIEPEF
jgi:putative sigma-54 modulation protein